MTSVLSAGAERLPPPPTILQQPESVHYPFENQFTSGNQEADMGFFAGFVSYNSLSDLKACAELSVNMRNSSADSP